MSGKTVRAPTREKPYEYLSLGRYVVSAPSVCRGRPTFKNTRVEVAGVLKRLAAGRSIQELVEGYRGRISAAAIEEAISLAAKALVKQAPNRPRS